MNPMPPRHRLTSLDQLRGIAMLLMVVDHTREFFYFHQQVSDPMDVTTTSTALFFTRWLSHLCAPTFVLLCGLSAWLYQNHGGRSRRETAQFLLVRGLVLIALEVTVVNLAWTFSWPPARLYLQVIWATGWSMLALSGLIWLPRIGQMAVCALVVFGHNLLDALHAPPDSIAFVVWAVLHDRSLIPLTEDLVVRTSYPVLPWIGIMLLGYLLGPLYAPGGLAAERRRKLFLIGAGALGLFVLLRGLNLYGDHRWSEGASWLHTTMSFLNVTKYPPSLHFCLLTVGVGWWLLALFEHPRGRHRLAPIGAAPMFFYVTHLYVLHLLYLALRWVNGTPPGEAWGFTHVWQVWAMALTVLAVLAPLCARVSQLKQRSRARWLSYF